MLRTIVALLLLCGLTAPLHADTPTTGGGLRRDCTTNQVLKWSGLTWICSTPASASGTVTNVSTVAPLQGGPITTTGSISLVACATNEIYKWNGSAFVCAADNNSGGDIDAVTAGNGLTGGGTTGSVTLDVACATGLTCSANQIEITSRDWGDITSSSTGSVWAVDSGAITLAKMANVATETFLGRTTAGTGVVEVMTPTQATALLDTFDSTHAGLVSASGGGTTNFARADGTWAAPTGGLSGLTTNTIPKAASATTATDSLLSDDGTTLRYNATAMQLGNTGNGSVAGSWAVGTYMLAGNQVYSYGGDSFMLAGSFGCWDNTNSDQTCKFNDVGYLEGTTRFRSLGIYDGKHGLIANFDGATKATTLNGDVALGDATGDALTLVGTVHSHVTFKARGNTISCGSGATQVTGSGDERGGINFSTATTTCQIAFVSASVAWTNAPFCTASLSSSGDVWVSAVSTSSVTFTLSSSKSSGDKLFYHCDGGI